MINRFRHAVRTSGTSPLTAISGLSLWGVSLPRGAEDQSLVGVSSLDTQRRSEARQMRGLLPSNTPIIPRSSRYPENALQQLLWAR